MPESSTSIDFKRLTVAERILLVEEIWDSIVEENGILPPTAAQRDELDRRLKPAEQQPATGNSWETIKSRLLEKT